MGQGNHPRYTIVLQLYGEDRRGWALIVELEVGGELGLHTTERRPRVGSKEEVIDMNRHHDTDVATLVHVDRVIAIHSFETYVSQNRVKLQCPYARSLLDAIEPLQ